MGCIELDVDLKYGMKRQKGVRNAVYQLSIWAICV